MAFSSLLRRSSVPSALPLAIRRAVPPEFSDSSISIHAALCHRDDGGVKCRGSSFHLSSFRFFSSAGSVASKKLDTYENMMQIINGVIQFATKEIRDLAGEKPFGFPFIIQDTPGTKTVSLKRKFQNELITVIVDLPNGEKGGDGRDQVCIPLAVTIEKGISLRLEFGITACPDEIVVEYMVIKSPDISDHGVPYEGRDFRDLEENMQKAVFEYLAVRGIEPNVTCFLIAYMMTKGGEEYVQWLKNLRQFCH